MSWVKATVSFIHAWRHPDQIACDVEAELRFHVDMRARANIEGGMKPDEAQRAALQSFGDFNEIKATCCEITRSPPFDPMILKMGSHIAIAVLAGGLAYWAVNTQHDNIMGVLRQLVAIAVLARLFVVVRRARSAGQVEDERASNVLGIERQQVRQNEVLTSTTREQCTPGIAAHDEQGRTPLERMFDSD